MPADAKADHAVNAGCPTLPAESRPSGTAPMVRLCSALDVIIVVETFMGGWIPVMDTIAVGGMTAEYIRAATNYSVRTSGTVVSRTGIGREVCTHKTYSPRHLTIKG